MIRSRQLLPCPDMCAPRMYALMVECWAEMPHRRPHFDELNGRLKQWLIPLLPPQPPQTNPNGTLSHHANSNSGPGSNTNYPFVAGSQSCASNNSQSSHQSHNSSTGPTSNNTNSTNVSNMAPAWQQQQQQNQFQQRPQLQQSPSHCVAYQSTPIVHCPINCQGGGGGGRYSPQHYPPNPATSTPVNHAHQHPHPHFHGNPVRMQQQQQHQQSFGSGPGSAHSHSPYRVLMESKATNI
jgi:receptor tyrosine kinase-like orphan receptor 1